MRQAWVFINANGYSKSRALTCAWANFKLRAALAVKTVRFTFEKADGTIRQAVGTLREVPATTGARPASETVQTYWDTEKRAWRCFRRANLLTVCP